MTIFLLDRNSEFLFIYEYYHRYQFGTGILRIYEFYLKMMALFLLDGIYKTVLDSVQRFGNVENNKKIINGI